MKKEKSKDSAMESFFKFFDHVTLSDVASIITIISFVFTVIMFFDIKSIKRYYFLTARVPEVAEKLILLKRFRWSWLRLMWF